jgi:hypothetical protein
MKERMRIAVLNVLAEGEQVKATALWRMLVVNATSKGTAPPTLAEVRQAMVSLREDGVIDGRGRPIPGASQRIGELLNQAGDIIAERRRAWREAGGPAPRLVLLSEEVENRALLAEALKTIPMGTAYAVWTGIGAVGTGRHADEPVADDADHPRTPFFVEGQAVREGAGTELGNHLLVAQAAVGPQRKPRQPPREGLVDIEPAAAGVHGHFVGVAQPFSGDESPPVRPHTDDEAVVAAAPIAQRPRHQPRADRDPGVAIPILHHVVRRWQRLPTHGQQPRGHAAVAP